MDKWQRINYLPNVKLGSDCKGVTSSLDHRTLSKNSAKEGMVLLKNSEQVLPLLKGSQVALFGKASFDYVKGGGGSGDVTVSYVTNLYEGVKQLADFLTVYEPLSDFYKSHVENAYKEGREPGLVSEPDVPEPLFKKASINTDIAIVSFCRFSGEGWDRKSSKDQDDIEAEDWVGSTAKQANEIFEDGDFYLSHQENKLIQSVKKYFKKIIINMNVGGMVDSQWFAQDDQIQSVLMSWQGGMEGGLATAELLCGIGNPSGKLVDSFAKDLSDYPSTETYHDSKDFVDYTDDIYIGYRFFETIPKAKDKINYPFGFGLSYSSFEIEHLATDVSDTDISIRVKVLNSGNYEGREVIQLYSMAPQGKLGKSAKHLSAFKKSRLLKRGESEILSISFPIDDLSSYDDLGKIKKSAYILEKGEYHFFLGNSSRDGVVLKDTYTVLEDRIIKQLSAKLVPSLLKERLLSDGTFEQLPEYISKVEKPSNYDGEEPGYMMPQSRFVDGMLRGHLENIISLRDVAKGDNSLEEFMAQLGVEDKLHLLGGQPNVGVANTYGFGNIPEFGIPSAMTADGPAGLRIEKECGVCTTAWPCATLLASTWDEDVLYKVGEAGAKEVKENNLAIWLTPALNIHRSPLCGRNFEYYSEDPLISGKLGAAMVRGIQSKGIAATVKHFAFNNKETNRKNSDSRLSERAAREIYLKGFEIIVKEADPWALMSAYNMVNGERTSECHGLLEGILRDEWGFKGVVTTDWWTRGDHDREVMAGNDIKMGCGFPKDLYESYKNGTLDVESVDRSVKRVLELLLKLD